MTLAGVLVLGGCGSSQDSSATSELSQYCPQGLVENLALDADSNHPHTPTTN